MMRPSCMMLGCGQFVPDVALHAEVTKEGFRYLNGGRASGAVGDYARNLSMTSRPMTSVKNIL